MTVRRRLAVIRIASLGALVAFAAGPASAQGLFDMLFGSDPRPNHHVPPQANSYADPYGAAERPATPSLGTGRAVSYCVRLCDGRYFPMQRHANASPAQLCSSFCPASKTQIFNGGAIDHAVAPNGARYADLDNAFVYRKKIVDGCTCNGKDTFGLARIDLASDPTLRPGDIVAAADGTTKVNNANVSRSARNAPRTPQRGPARQFETAPDDDLPED